MTKQDFLFELQECLAGQISDGELAETLKYYNEYIGEEMAGGKTEEEVLNSLGSPRLIAHSIIDAHEDAVSGSPGGYYDAEDETFREEGQLPAADRMKYLAVRAGTIVAIAALVLVGITLLNALLPPILIGLLIFWIIRSTQQ